MKTLLSILLLIFAAPAHAREVEGVVDSVNGNTLSFRTADQDLAIDLAKLPAAQKKLLKEPKAKEKIFKVEIPNAAIKARKNIPFGVRSNCTELPFSPQELEAIAARPDINNIEDFLRAIPKGALQSFTFVTNSLSAQRGTGDSKVSPLWPRVLRGSIDGKVTMTYTCNPNSETHNQVEVIYFDGEKFQTMHLALGGTRQNRLDRIHHNPTSCIKCHSSGTPINGQISLKPNWQQYFFWGDCKLDRGIAMYGMSDDNIGGANFRSRDPLTPDDQPKGCDEELDRTAAKTQEVNFREFRAAQKNNPCYSSLPWADPKMAGKSPWDYSAYPYAKEAQQLENNLANYSLRTNLRFTDAYSRLMHKRIHKLLKKTPEYEGMKYYLALEAAGCLRDSDQAGIKALLPGFETLPPPPVPVSQPLMDPRTAPLLYSFARRQGITDADWTMEFDRKNNPVYSAGIPRMREKFSLFSGPPPVGDVGIREGVQAELLHELAAENPDMDAITKNNFSSGVQEAFGQDFACFDKEMGYLKVEDRSEDRKSGKMCEVFRAQNEAHLEKLKKTLPSTLSPDTSKSQFTSLSQVLIDGELVCVDKPDDPLRAFVRLNLDVLKKLRNKEIGPANLAASVERGRVLVQEGPAQCIRCHSPTAENIQARPASFLFMPNEKLGAEANQRAAETLRARVKEGFFGDIEWHVSEGDMPPLRNVNLSKDERKDVINYLRDKARQR